MIGNKSAVFWLWWRLCWFFISPCIILVNNKTSHFGPVCSKFNLKRNSLVLKAVWPVVDSSMKQLTTGPQLSRFHARINLSLTPKGWQQCVLSCNNSLMVSYLIYTSLKMNKLELVLLFRWSWDGLLSPLSPPPMETSTIRPGAWLWAGAWWRLSLSGSLQSLFLSWWKQKETHGRWAVIQMFVSFFCIFQRKSLLCKKKDLITFFFAFFTASEITLLAFWRLASLPGHSPRGALLRGAPPPEEEK